jgi:hypothetical protein
MSLGPNEVYEEIVRLVEEAETEEKAVALGFMFGRIEALRKEVFAAIEQAGSAPPPTDPEAG